MISFDRTRDDRQRCQHGNPRLLFYSRRKRVKAKNVVRLRVLKAETRKGLEDPRGRSHRCSTTHRALSVIRKLYFILRREISEDKL